MLPVGLQRAETSVQPAPDAGFLEGRSIRAALAGVSIGVATSPPCSKRYGYIAWVEMERIHVDLDKEWLSVPDICEYMDVSAFVVTSQLRSGTLPGVKFGREWRVSRQDFEDWINMQRFAAAARSDGPGDDGGGV